MGQAVDIPLVYGPGHYIVMEQGDEFFCREQGVVADGAGKLNPGTVMSQLKADRTVTVNGVTYTQHAGEFVPYADGNDNACILWQGIDARKAGAKRAFTIRDTQVHSAKLTVAFAATNAQILAMYSLLAVNRIIQR